MIERDYYWKKRTGAYFEDNQENIIRPDTLKLSLKEHLRFTKCK